MITNHPNTLGDNQMDWKKYFALGSSLIIWPTVIWASLHGIEFIFAAVLGFVGTGISLMLIGIIDQF